MELGEENGSDTWRVCYPQKQTQGVGVLGVHANTNGRQGSGGKDPLWHKQLQEQQFLYRQGRKPWSPTLEICCPQSAESRFSLPTVTLRQLASATA